VFLQTIEVGNSGGVGCYLGGGWLGGIRSGIDCASTTVNFRDAVWMIPFSLTAAAFIYLHLLQRSRAAMLEAIGFYAVMMASLLAFLGNVGVLTNFPLLAKFGFPWGALLWMAGLIVFGIGTWTARTAPWYVGLPLILLSRDRC